MKRAKQSLALLLILTASLLLSACGADTEPVTDVTTTAATLHADVSGKKGEDTVYWFEYRKQGASSWTRGPVRDPGAFGGDFSSVDLPERITGLTPATTYQFRFCGYLTKPYKAGSSASPICFDSDGSAQTGSWESFKTAAEPPPPTTQLQSCGWGTFSTASKIFPGACWRPFADNSPWNRRLPANPPIAANSDSKIQRWVSMPDANKMKFGTNADATQWADYDHPIYFSSPGDPSYTVHCAESWGTCPIEGMSVKIPAGARAASGSDGHMGVIDQAGGWEYDFWQVRSKGSGAITISWGGRSPIGGNGDSGVGTSNATAANFALSAGVIRPEELRAGRMDHALFIVEQCTTGIVYPANHDDGSSCKARTGTDAGASAMGQRYFLDMSDAQINALSAPEWKKTILVAFAHYGAIVGDSGGGSMKTMSGSSYTSVGLADPWQKLAVDFGISGSKGTDGHTYYTFDLRNTVDWASKMKVVAPCWDAGTC